MIAHLQVLVGTIASGKSTYSQNCALEGMVIVNDDALVTAVHGGKYTLYDRLLTPLYKTVENTILSTAIALNRPVVVDRGTNNKRSSRRRWIGLAHALNVPVVAVEFPAAAPEVHARRRCEDDPRDLSFADWLKIAERHLADYQPPTTEEGFDYVVTAEWTRISDRWVYRPACTLK